jgi:hypothetical protein
MAPSDGQMVIDGFSGFFFMANTNSKLSRQKSQLLPGFPFFLFSFFVNKFGTFLSSIFSEILDFLWPA